MSSLEITPIVLPEVPTFHLVKGGLDSVTSHLSEEVVSRTHEIFTALSGGIEVTRTVVIDAHGLSPEKQAEVDADVTRMEALGYDFSDELFDAATHPGGNAWTPLNKRAIALHTLYNASTVRTLGDGIDPSAYDNPLFDGLTARQVIRAEKAKNPEKAEAILVSYDRFIATEIEPDMEGWLSSRDYFRGVKDAVAVRRRAISAMNMVTDHIMATNLRDRPVVSASMACGAAQPIYGLDKQLTDTRGFGLDQALLIDNDAMALASAWSLAEAQGVVDRITLHKQDLLRDKVTSYIEPGSVDVVDLLGIFEYLPETYMVRNVARYRPAEQLLQDARSIVRPGGIIVLGNMLTDRPQQGFFNYVWPKLEQRTVEDVVRIIENAGFNREDLMVTMPNEDPIYAVYGIKVPEHAPNRQPSLGASHAIGRLLVQH